VFICHCGSNIAGVVDVKAVRDYAGTLPGVVFCVVDVKAVRDYAGTLPGVVFCENTLYSCSQDALKGLADKIKENRLNRVVIACSPRTHEPLFQETLKSIGLNPALIEMANIRNQCSWVHSREPKAATEKAKDLVRMCSWVHSREPKAATEKVKDLVRMAVAKAGLLEPLEQTTVDVSPSALVIGGGAGLLEPLEQTTVDVSPSALVIGGGAAGMTAAISIADQGFECVLVERAAGMTAAISIADQGFECVLVERSDQLGGNLRRLVWTMDGEKASNVLDNLIKRVNGHPDGEKASNVLDNLIKRVNGHPGIQVMLQAQVEAVSGYVGNFTSSIVQGGQSVVVDHQFPVMWVISPLPLFRGGRAWLLITA